jgi:hypothetical protein
LGTAAVIFTAVGLRTPLGLVDGEDGEDQAPGATAGTCVTDQEGQKILERDIDRVLEATGKQPSQIRALDACGGSGNISLKLLRRGVNVTLADISSELQGIFEKKCAEHGYEPTVVCSEIGRFIASGSEPFDLIVFSSALHHGGIVVTDSDEVVTDSDEAADFLRLYRNHGLVDRDHVSMWGVNERLQPVQAVVATRLLDEIEDLVEMRGRNARLLDEGLKDLGDCVTIPERPPGYREVYQLYQVTVKSRAG